MITHILQKVADFASTSFARKLAFDKCPNLGLNYEPELAQLGDVVNVPILRKGAGGLQESLCSVTLRHVEVTFTIPHCPDGCAESDLKRIERYATPAINAIAERINAELDAAGALPLDADVAFVTRRIPLPLPSSGAYGIHVQALGFGFRVVHDYQNYKMGQRFTIDCLYGVGRLQGESLDELLWKYVHSAVATFEGDLIASLSRHLEREK